MKKMVWLPKNQTGCTNFLAMRRRESEHQLEKVGADFVR